MASGSVIKSFLVSLGYQHDEAGMKKLVSGVASVSKTVVALGAAIEATAIAVATGVMRIASNLEALYFASRRTESSADSLRAFGQAARNFGASTDEALGSVEALAAFMRNTPGGQNLIAGWLARVGLSAKDANGQMLTGVNLTAQLGKMFGAMRQQGQWPLASIMAGQLGISDNTALAMSNPGFEAELARQEKLSHGWNKAAADAHKFRIQIEDFKTRLFQQLLPFESSALMAIERVLLSLTKFMDAHGREIVPFFEHVFRALMDGFKEVIDFFTRNDSTGRDRISQYLHDIDVAYRTLRPALVWLKDEFFELDRVTDGWSTKLLAAATALKLMGATGIVTGIASLGAGLARAFGATVVGAAALAEGGTVWAAAGTAFGAAAAVGIGVALGAVIDHFLPQGVIDFIQKSEGYVQDTFESEFAKYKAFTKDPHSMTNPFLFGGGSKEGGTTTINSTPTVNVTVNSTQDPHAVGKEVADQTSRALKDREYSDVMREMLGVVR